MITLDVSGLRAFLGRRLQTDSSLERRDRLFEAMSQAYDQADELHAPRYMSMYHTQLALATLKQAIGRKSVFFQENPRVLEWEGFVEEYSRDNLYVADSCSTLERMLIDKNALCIEAKQLVKRLEKVALEKAALEAEGVVTLKQKEMSEKWHVTVSLEDKPGISRQLKEFAQASLQEAIERLTPTLHTIKQFYQEHAGYEINSVLIQEPKVSSWKAIVLDLEEVGAFLAHKKTEEDPPLWLTVDKPIQKEVLHSMAQLVESSLTTLQHHFFLERVLLLEQPLFLDYVLDNIWTKDHSALLLALSVQSQKLEGELIKVKASLEEVDHEFLLLKDFLEADLNNIFKGVGKVELREGKRFNSID